MRHELYIDDKLVDLGDANISLNFKSNLLTDISKIVSNNSYTIKLPKTAKNLALIECAGSPFSGTKFPYLNHRGRLLRNGVEIISDANVVLTGVDDSINIALSWGAGSNLQRFVKGDKKLTDLSYDVNNVNERVIWKKESTSRYPKIDYGFRDGEPNVWYHPVVSAGWVLDKIAKDGGVKFDIPTEHRQMIDRMIIPLLTKNDAGELIKKSTITMPLNGFEKWNGEFELPYMTICFFMDMTTQTNVNHCGKFETRVLDAQGYEQETSSFKVSVSNARINVKGDIKVRVSSPNGLPNGLCFALVGRIDHELMSISPERVTNVSGNLYDVFYHIDNQSDIIPYNEMIVDFALKDGPSGLVFYAQQSSGSVTFSFEVDEVKLQTSNPNEGKYYFVPNLPAIKQIDFIKSLMQMLGLFALTGAKNTIKLVPFDLLLQNKNKAVDWTKKVVRAYKYISPNKIEYKVDNVAQKNLFVYKDDKTVRGNYNGQIVVDDATLEEEKDVAKLPFAASDERASVANIPIYSYNDKGEIEYNKVEPRILIKYDGNNVGRFYGLAWANLLAKYYSSYKQIMSQAKVITEQIRLSDIDLRDIQMDVPVYIGQYGSYFAIIDIKTKGDSICDVKLIKI